MMISKDAVRLEEQPAATPTQHAVSSNAMLLVNSQGIVVSPVDVPHQPVLQSPPPLTSPTIETSILGREQMLKELGFDSQYINDGWIKEFHALAAYLRAYGQIPEGPLKNWVNVQMQHRNQHALTRYQEQLLVELGIFRGPLTIGCPQVPKTQEESQNIAVEVESTQVFCTEIQNSDKATEDATEVYSPPPIKLFKKKSIKCKDPSCSKYARRNGVCARHGATIPRCTFPGGCKLSAIRYKVCYNHGAPKKIKKKCLYCNKNARKGGICQSHRAKRENICPARGCKKKVTQDGFCTKHSPTATT